MSKKKILVDIYYKQLKHKQVEIEVEEKDDDSYNIVNDIQKKVDELTYYDFESSMNYLESGFSWECREEGLYL